MKRCSTLPITSEVLTAGVGEDMRKRDLRPLLVGVLTGTQATAQTDLQRAVLSGMSRSPKDTH